MAVYVDDAIWQWHGLKWCHLLADTPEELHRFASALGLHRSSYQGPPKTSTPHYDITGFERSRAVALGAQVCSRAEIVAVARLARAWCAPHQRRPLRRPAAASSVASKA